MKKKLIGLGIVIVIIIGGLIFMQTVNLNRLGADAYYTQIKGEGKTIEDKMSDGSIFTRYEYELPAYDKDGNEKTLTFTATKQLREDAYLLLYVKNSKGVTSYQEVKAEDLPEKAADLLK